MPTPLPLVQPIESVTLTGTGSTARWESSRYLYDAQNRLSRQVEGAGSAAEHLIYLEGYEDRVGGYRTRSYVDDYAHITRYRYGQLELRFVLTDRLGSVVGVVRADRDSVGSVRALEPEVGLAYDVFGAPRHASDWSPLVGTESWPQARNPWDVTPTTRHGFTGHEMLSKQRLIHMRGRLFDPRMGRFTGVDPVIQFPLSTQGLNPYSYLLNNPLAGTDPTGYVTVCETFVVCTPEQRADKNYNHELYIGGSSKDNGFRGQGTSPTSRTDGSEKGASEIGSQAEVGKCGGSGPLTCYTVQSSGPTGEAKVLGESASPGGVGYLNGIRGGAAGDPSRAAYLGVRHLRAEVEDMPATFTVIHNPSNGPVRDMWEAFRDKIGWTTPAAKQLARILLDVQKSGGNLDLVAHSQGGAMFSEAVRYAYRQTNGFLNNIRGSFHGGANNIFVTNAIFARAGVERFGGIGGSGYRNHPFDAVPQVIGFNGVNPVRFIGSLWNSYRLFQDEMKSPHTLPYVPTGQK